MTDLASWGLGAMHGGDNGFRFSCQIKSSWSNGVRARCGPRLKECPVESGPARVLTSRSAGHGRERQAVVRTVRRDVSGAHFTRAKPSCLLPLANLSLRVSRLLPAVVRPRDRRGSPDRVAGTVFFNARRRTPSPSRSCNASAAPRSRRHPPPQWPSHRDKARTAGRRA